MYHKPWVGLLGLVVGFLTQPLGHAAYKVLEALFGKGDSVGDAVYCAALVTGIVGFVVIWSGLKRNELHATLLGLVGGWLVWVGWFEYAFKFFAVLYDVPGFAVEPAIQRGYVATPQANMLQATVTIMLALLLLYGFFNLQTKCNFMRFFHRHLRFSPGVPTPENRRSFARITAMEMLFVTWFCYLFWLYVIYFGTRGTGAVVVQIVYVVWAAWSIYLIWKCAQQIRVAASVRYGLGAGIVLWGSVEMPAHFGAYREYWLHPNEYPLFNAACFMVFMVGLLLLARRSRHSVAKSDADMI